jgi:folate-dependent phosphoribosylglycinamide formyltransferase PurN
MGVVLGARILPMSTVSAFRSGVINVHPGLAPWNRGLDSYKWAVVKCYGQGVTCHIIGERIDYGPLLVRRVLRSLDEASLPDVKKRLSAMAIELLPEAVLRGLSGARSLIEAPHPYHSRMTDRMTRQASREFERYKQDYPEIIESWIGYEY